jgi:signal transduction histidine kinase
LGSRIYLLRTLSNQIANPLSSDKDKQQQLSKFEEISQDAFKSIRDFIWAFDPKQDQLNLLFDRLEDFAENYVSPLVPALDITRDDVPATHQIGPRVKYHLINVYQELLTNMVKHTRVQHLQIDFRLNGRHLHIDIRNRHAGILTDGTLPIETLKAGQESIALRLKEVDATIKWHNSDEHTQEVRLEVPV